MYKGFEIIQKAPTDFISNWCSYQVKIIDDHFEDTAIVEMDMFRVSCGSIVVSAIIEVYGKRNLPIAPNLIRQMLQVKEEDGWSLDRQAKWNQQYNPRWKEVEEAMKMYLTFS